MVQVNKELKAENLLSLRKKMTMAKIQEEMKALEVYLTENKIEKNGSVITTTYSVEVINNEQVLDMEVLVPIITKDNMDYKYELKKEFYLTKAVYKKHIGNPNTIQDSYNQMNSYIVENKLIPITTGYNVNIKDLTKVSSIGEMEVDIYIGVNPNKL